MQEDESERSTPIDTDRALPEELQDGHTGLVVRGVIALGGVVVVIILLAWGFISMTSVN